MFGLHLLSLLGVAIALVGVGMLTVPRLTRRLLLVVGVRWEQGQYERIAAWLLVVLGLALAFVGRVAR